MSYPGAPMGDVDLYLKQSLFHDDHVLPPAEQLVMAKRAHSQIVKVDASHLSMLSKPRKAANLIIRAARTAG